MRCLLRKKFFIEPLELPFNPLNLLPRRKTLRLIQLYGRRPGQPPMRAVHNGSHHLQIAD